MSLSHPIVTSVACDRYDCGHITRSSVRPVKRALFLYVSEVYGLGYLGGREDAHTLAALALMREGAECARVLDAGTPSERATLDAAIDAAEADVATVPDLTPRQCEVLSLVSEGYSFPEIATRLGIAKETVRSLSKAAMRATLSHSIVEAAVIAARDGLI